MGPLTNQNMKESLIIFIHQPRTFSQDSQGESETRTWTNVRLR